MRIPPRPTACQPARRRGASAAEFALILPLLVVLVLGCIDFGRYVHGFIAVSSGARAGAGYGSSNPYTTATYSTWQSQVRDAVIEDMAQMGNFSSSQLTVTSAGVSEGNGHWRAEVQVSYTFQTLISWPTLPSSVTVRRTVKMRATR